MKSTFKKFASLFLALAMVCSLAVPAFAAEEPQNGPITVTITLQTWDKTVANSEPDVIDTVKVEINAGESVKDAVNKIPDLEIITCANDGEFGCIQTNGECACTANGGTCTCTWKQVQNVDANYQPIEGSYSSVLNSMTLGRDEYTNNGGSVVNDKGGHTYTGEAWEYYVGGTYPASEYMNQYKLTENTNVTLSFTKSSFDW